MNEQPISMLKQYVFVPKGSRMSSGKIASQVAHATFLALEKERNKNGFTNINKWLPGMCVIVLEAKDNNHLLQIEAYLAQWEIIHALYIDEGMTEVVPLTATALATGIMSPEQEWMFAKFKLYR